MIFELKAVRRALRKLTRKARRSKLVFRLERRLSDLVLLEVVGVAKTDAPSVRRLNPHAAVGAAADVGAFDWKLPAARTEQRWRLTQARCAAQLREVVLRGSTANERESAAQAFCFSGVLAELPAS